MNYGARYSFLAVLTATLISVCGTVGFTQEPSNKTEAATAQTAAVTPAKAPETSTARDTVSADEPTHPVVANLLNQLEHLKDASKDDLAGILAFYTAQSAKPIWTTRTGFAQPTKEAVAEIRKADDWGLKAKDFDLPSLDVSSFTEQGQAEAELKIAIAVLKYARHARGGRIKPRSVSRLFNHVPELAEPLTVLQSLATSNDVAKDLRQFHPQHPQFERLRQALLDLRRKNKQAATKAKQAEAATESTTDAKKNNLKKTAKAKPAASALKLIVNMERWRWMPRTLGEFYVWDDVPAQYAKVIHDGEVVLKEKMVVGKPSTPTPMFSAPMQYIVFHPSWGVPPGMKKNELGPQLRNTGGGWFSSKPLASTVLKSHGLRVSRNGRPVNPDSVDWSSVNVSNYHFTQPPGPKNVLGIVKFRFPNKHHVYMHDTPERHLFNGRARTFSHGCMRVQNPMKLANVLLKYDRGWDAGQVKAAKRRGANIELENSIPVHIAYFTVEVEDSGEVKIHRDIYGLDNRTASKLEGRKTRLGGPAIAGKKKRTKRSRRYTRKKKKKPKKKPFNPFASLSD